jgi:hypothetical protein
MAWHPAESRPLIVVRHHVSQVCLHVEGLQDSERRQVHLTRRVHTGGTASPLSLFTHTTMSPQAFGTPSGTTLELSISPPAVGEAPKSGAHMATEDSGALPHAAQRPPEAVSLRPSTHLLRLLYSNTTEAFYFHAQKLLTDAGHVLVYVVRPNQQCSTPRSVSVFVPNYASMMFFFIL